MKVTIIITISLVIVLSLSSAGTLLTYNNNNLLALKLAGGGSSDGGGHGSKGGDNNGGSKGNDNNNGGNGVATETHLVDPGMVGNSGSGHNTEHCTFGAKCLHPGDGFTFPPEPPPVACLNNNCGSLGDNNPIDPNRQDCRAQFFDGMGCHVNDPHFVGCNPFAIGAHCDNHHHHTHDDNNNDQVLHIVKDRSSSTTAAVPVFKESTDIPVETGVSIGPTSKTVDTAGWLHIVGDIKNDGQSSVTIEPQISGRVMNSNDQTIGIEYATPLTTTIQPGQSTAFEMLVGGTGIPNLSDIASIQYHVGIVGSSK